MRIELSRVLFWMDRMTLTSALRSRRLTARPLAVLALMALAMLWSAPAHAQINLGTYPMGEVYAQLPGPAVYAPDPASTLPPGLSLRLDTPPFFPPNVPAGVIGVATTTVRTIYQFNLIKNGATTSYQMTITPLSIRSSWNLPDAFVNEPFSYQLAAQNLGGPATWSQSGSWPAGLSISPSGLISGTPTVAGSFGLGVQLNDGVDTVFRSFNLNIDAVHVTIAGALADGSLPNATQNAPYSATFSASGGSGGYTFSSNSLPSGLSLDPTTGVLSGTPTSFGPWRFIVTATDSNHVSNSKWVSLDVVGAPARLPNVRPYDGYLIDASFAVPYNVGVSVGSGGRAPFTWSVSGLPPGLGIRSGAGNTQYWINPGDVEIHGTPIQMGTFQVQLTVTDADGVQATNTFPMNVKPLHLWNWMANGLYGVPYNHTFYLVGGQLPYSVVQAGGQLPLGLTLNSSALSVTGTPQEHGPFSPTVLFSDSAGNQLKLNQYPNIGDPTSTIQIFNNGDLGTITAGFSYSNRLVGCCVPSYSWSVVSGTLPPGLTLTAGGLLSGTVPGGTSGTYQFLVRVEDGSNPSNFAVRQFTAVITPMNIVGSTILPTANVNAPYSVSLFSTGGTGAVTWTLEPNQYLPPGLALLSGGGISGTPTGPGQFNFSLRASDSAGHTMVRFFTINVYPSGVNPPLDMPSLSTRYVPTVGQFTIVLSATGGQGPYHYALSPGANVIPGLRVQDGQPLPTFFLPLQTAGILAVFTTPGDYSTSIRVTDSLGASFDKAVTFHVTPLQFLNVSPLPRGVVGAPYSFTLTPSGGTSYTFAASGLPAGLDIDSATGQIFGTPTAATATTTQITLTDLVSLEALTWTFNITVDPFDITQGDLPQATVNSFYSQALSAPGCGSPCAWTVVSGGIGGLTLSGAGVLSGTPTGTNTGAALTVRASGPNGAAQKTLGLRVVSATPQPLAITTGSFSDTTIGNTPLFSLAAQGGTPPYSWSLAGGTLPTGVHIQAANDLVSATQTPGLAYLTGRFTETNLFTFTLRVTDAASNSVTRAFTWRVSPLTNQYFSLPLAAGGLVYNTPYSQPLLAMGGTGSYTWTATAPMPPGLTLNPSTGVVSGTPLNTGSFSVPVQITDGAASFLANIGFTIGSGTPATIGFSLGSTLGPTTLGSAFNFTVAPIGGTGPYTITADTPLPSGMALVPFGGTGQPAGTMSLVGVATTPGAYTFTLRIVDSLGNLGVRTFTWTVGNFGVIGTALPNGSVGVPYSQSLLTFGGAVTWALGSGSALPPGLSLSPSGTISGTPTTNGVFSFVAVGTSGGVSSSFTLSLTISGIAITSGELPVGVVNQPYLFTFTATGGGTLNWTATGLPPGLTLTNGGVLSGTPSSAGTFTLVVGVSGTGVSPLTQRYALFVTQPNPTILDVPMASTVLLDATVGSTFQSTLTPNGGVPPYTWSVASGSSLPPGLRLVPGSQALLSASPAVTLLLGEPTVAGSYAFDLIVTDSLGAQARRTFHLKVSELGLASLPSNAVSGTPYAFQFVPFGGAAPFTFTMAPSSATQDMLPPGLSMTSGGSIAGTPTSTGSYRFRLHVQDNAGHSLDRIVLLNVLTASGLQVQNLNPPTTPVGRGRGAMTLSAFSNAAPTATYSWSVAGGTLPPGMALITSGQLPGIGPDTTLLGGQPTTAGDYTFTLRATNKANASDTADHAFSLHVSRVRLVSPAIDFHSTNALAAGHVGSPYQFQYAVGGGVPPYTFAVSPFSPLPAGFTLDASGLLSGTPNSIGNYAIGMVVTDSTGDAITINTVLPVTPPGVAEPMVQVGDIDPPAVGAPFVGNLDLLRRGGQAPITWSVSAGSLPAGLSLVPAENGLPARVQGVLAAAGPVDFTLTATDAAGQTITFAAQGDLPDLGFSTPSAPPARVGQPYSLPLSPRGAAPPLTVSIDPTFDLPPGLTLSGTGLSGTPSAAGTFIVGAIVGDGLGEFLEKFYRIAVDNAAGEVPAIDVAPNPIQVYFETGSPNPAPVAVGVSTTSGALPFAASLDTAPWANLGTSSGTTPGSVTLNVTPGSLAVGTYVGFVGASASGAVNQFAMTPVYFTVANPPPCSYAVNPSAGTMQTAGGKGSFGVSTAANCSWTATTADAWISLLAGPSGPVVASISDTGTKTVSFSAAPNPDPSARVGTITVNGAVFTLTQFGSSCAFTISPADLSVSAAGGIAGIGVTASASSCSWTASGLGATPASGTGNATVSVTVPPNPDAGSRVLTATIAGQTLSVTQAGIACSVSLSGAGANHPASGGNGAVTVTTPVGCGYGSTVGPNWISITSGESGSGSGTLVYSVAPNPATFARSATLFIGGQPFLVTQDALACSITIDSTGLGSPYGSTGGNGTLGITTNGANCTWSAASDAPWAAVAPASGTGSGTVFVNVGSNAGSPSARNGNLFVGGQTLPVSQAGVNCSYSLQSSTASVPGGGGAGSVGVVAPAACTWTAASNAPWLSIGSSGTAGSSSVQFIAQPNPTASIRAGTLTIAGMTYTVNQAAAPCTYSLNSSGVTVGASGGTGQFTFSTGAAGCAADVKSYASWVHVTASLVGTSGTAAYIVDSNPAGGSRSGVVQVGNQVFTVTETAADCAFSLNAYGKVFDKNGGFGTLFGSPSALGCTPDYGTSEPSFISLGLLTGPANDIFSLPYQVLQFPPPLTPYQRRGFITLGGQVFTVKQTSW